MWVSEDLCYLTAGYFGVCSGGILAFGLCINCGYNRIAFYM